MKLTLQIHDSYLGWLDTGELTFHGRNDVAIEYELNYGCQYLGKKACHAFSVLFPVNLAPYRGPVPGFLVDLVPQGNILRRLMGRYGIRQDDDYGAILANCPLASPGNLRIKEPWARIERERPVYDHPGFPKAAIVAAKENFIEYMEEHGAPIGGTSGAAGGAPKFLLREDMHGHFHADGYLDDEKTRQAYLIKFPFTDSSNSRLLTQTEKAYYDLLKELPVVTGSSIEIHDDILFIPRFDRVREGDGRLHYHGLESLYSAHGLNTHGQELAHEDNLLLIRQYSSDWQEDAAEYLIRDLLNQALSNNDNHGRNTSLIKAKDQIRISPIYDVTAMRFFKGDFIVPLTKWQRAPLDLRHRLAWLGSEFGLDDASLGERLRNLRDNFLGDLDGRLRHHGVPQLIIDWSRDDREAVLRSLRSL